MVNKIINIYNKNNNINNSNNTIKTLVCMMKKNLNKKMTLH